METNKYKKYYDETVGACKKCNPKGFLPVKGGFVSCECLIKYHWMKELHDSHLPRLYWNKKVCDFEGDKKAVDIVHEYMTNLESNLSKGLGLYLQGTHGIGKTLLASYILKQGLKIGKQSKFYYYTDMLNVFSDSWKDDEAKQEIETDIMQSDLLVIDDLGKEIIGKSNFSITSLDSVLRKRVGNLKSIILTSNLDKLDVKDVYGKAIIDLFNESLKEVHVIGDSYRGKHE